MSDWSAGYVDEIAYTYGYCDELNPLRLKLALLQAGLAGPRVETACELGFGHGVSVNIHAAGSATQWYGTDFNPSQAGFAQRLASRAQVPAQLSAERFIEFFQRRDLPDFDYIGMHGLWSWISVENRALIVDFIRRKLKPGGVVYLSYNSQPGWTAMLPVRELMHRHFQAGTAAPDERASPEQALSARITAAVGFAQTLMAAQPGYAQANPQLAERVRALSDESLNYLAHEYFSRDWQPMPFGQVAALLDEAGLSYAGSAHYRDHLDELNLTPNQRAMVAAVADPVLRETVRDFCVNQSFRRDYWVKGARRLEPGEQLAALRTQRVVLALPRQRVVLKATGALGEAALPQVVYGPLLDALSHHRPMTLQELEAYGRGMSVAQIARAAMLLISIGVLLNAQDDAEIEAAEPATRRLNTAIFEQACQHGELQFLASPVSGSGVRVPHVPQLFLLARQQGRAQPAQWADFAWAALQAQAAPEGVLRASPGLTELTAHAQRFAQIQLPVLQALRIA